MLIHRSNCSLGQSRSLLNNSVFYYRCHYCEFYLSGLLPSTVTELHITYLSFHGETLTCHVAHVMKTG